VLNWIGRVNRMDSKRNISQIFNKNPQGIRLSERQKNRWWNYVQTDINRCKIKNWTERSKTEITLRSPLRRRRSALDCSAIWDYYYYYYYYYYRNCSLHSLIRTVLGSYWLLSRRRSVTNIIHGATCIKCQTFFCYWNERFLNHRTDFVYFHAFRPGADGRTIFERILMKQDGRGVDWVDLAQDRDMLTSWGTVSFSRRTLLYVVPQLVP